MISGKRRKKAAPPGVAVKAVAVDGTEYQWWTRHGWQIWGTDTKVISISVSLEPARTRELILDMTMTMNPEDNTPSETRLAQAVGPAIRAAIEAGWDPESRGRAFRFEIEESL